MNIHKLDYIIEDKDYSLRILVLDGQKEDQVLEAFALEKSAESDGLYPILNCTCGEWGCGGYWVKVKHQDDKVIWEKIRTYGVDKDITRLHVNTPVAFNQNEYSTLIKKMVRELELYPGSKKFYLDEKKHYEETGRFNWTGFSAPD